MEQLTSIEIELFRNRNGTTHFRNRNRLIQKQKWYSSVLLLILHSELYIIMQEELQEFIRNYGSNSKWSYEGSFSSPSMSFGNQQSHQKSVLSFSQLTGHTLPAMAVSPKTIPDSRNSQTHSPAECYLDNLSGTT